MTCPRCDAGDADCPAAAHEPAATPRTRAELEAVLRREGLRLTPTGTPSYPWCLHAPRSPLLNRDGMLALSELAAILADEATTPGSAEPGSGGAG